jgi:hypothetical protein
MRSSLLSIIKKESPELKSLLERISETSKATATELETFSQTKSATELKGTHVPRLEQAARIHRQGYEQRDSTQQRRGLGVQYGEFATGSNELRRASDTRSGRC